MKKMDKNEKKGWIILLVIVAIVASLSIIPWVPLFIEKANYKKAYKAELDKAIPKIYNDKLWKSYKLSDLSYSLDYGKGTLFVTIDCKGPDPLVDPTGDPSPNFNLSMMLRDYIPNFLSNYPPEKLTFIISRDIKLNGYTIYSDYDMFHPTVTADSSSNVECKSCHKSFQKGSENAKSINRTNMCTDCYNSFKALDHWKKEQPVK